MDMYLESDIDFEYDNEAFKMYKKIFFTRYVL